MNLERVFESILRIYPKSFRERFGEELTLGFQDELNSKPSNLEVARLLSDTLTAAVWERLQATTWLYWLMALSTIAAYTFSIVSMLLPSSEHRISEVLQPYYPFIFRLYLRFYSGSSEFLHA
jgi:hypothetical protein